MSVIAGYDSYVPKCPVALPESASGKNFILFQQKAFGVSEHNEESKPYSYRNATIGSTFAARREGRYEADIATPVRRAATAKYVR